MNIINYFKFVATGYIRKKKMLHGTAVHFTYRHDTEIFDPFKLVLDQYYKISQLSPESEIGLDTDFAQVKKTLENLEDKKPKVIVKFKIKAGEIEMHRRVLKEHKRTTSLYVVYLNQKPLFFLNKKYDYGNELQELLLKNVLSEVKNKKIPENHNEFTSYLFFNPQEEACFIEKFVHTHIFFILDVSDFNKICEEMSEKLHLHNS